MFKTTNLLIFRGDIKLAWVFTTSSELYWKDDIIKKLPRFCAQNWLTLEKCAVDRWWPLEHPLQPQTYFRCRIISSSDSLSLTSPFEYNVLHIHSKGKFLAAEVRKDGKIQMTSWDHINHAWVGLEREWVFISYNINHRLIMSLTNVVITPPVLKKLCLG